MKQRLARATRIFLPMINESGNTNVGGRRRYLYRYEIDCRARNSMVGILLTYARYCEYKSVTRIIVEARSIRCFIYCYYQKKKKTTFAKYTFFLFFPSYGDFAMINYSNLTCLMFLIINNNKIDRKIEK